MPAPQRAKIVEEEAMVSWATPNPTLTADLEGWLNYETSENRWYWWNGTSWIKIPTFPVPNAELADMAQQTVKGRADGVGTGAPVDLTRAQVQAIIKASATVAADTIPITDAGGSGGKLNLANWAKGNGAQISLLQNSLNDIVSWKGFADTPHVLIHKTGENEYTGARFNGTSFPTSPVDGQWHYRTDLRMYFYYDSTAVGWLSFQLYEREGGDNGDTATGTYLRFTGGNLASSRYSSTVGWRFGFDVKVVRIEAECGAAQANSCSVDVMDDGTAVTNGVLALAASDAFKINEDMMSATIAANSVIGIKVSGTGPFEGPNGVKVGFRRFEA